VLGNVLTRADANENLTETFAYDALNRLTQAQVSQNIAPLKSFAYDVIGNLLSKSDVGTYAYPLAGSARPHAVTSISSGNINNHLHLRPQRQPDLRPRPQHHLHLLQQTVVDHARVRHAELFPRRRPSALQANRSRGPTFRAVD
jgi:hypothetical protein